MEIRVTTDEDFDAIWPVFHEIVTTGETYAYDRDTPREQFRYLWMELPRQTYVAEEDGKILGTYYIKTN